jgi:hypothetical protein
MNRTITERARSMVIAADLNKGQWGEAVLTAVNLINISPTKALEANKTPYELWHNKKLKIQYLSVFGSTEYVHNKIRKSKFDQKSFKGKLVRYAPNGYKVWDPSNQKFLIARDLIFDEINFKISRPLLQMDETMKTAEAKTVIKSDNHKADKTVNNYVPFKSVKTDCDEASNTLDKTVLSENDKSGTNKTDKSLDKQNKLANHETDKTVDKSVSHETDKPVKEIGTI